MLEVRKDIPALLSASADVTAAVGDRIFPVLAPQGTPFPYITYEVVSVEPAHHHGGRSADGDKYVMVVGAWSERYLEAASIAAAIDAALDTRIGATTLVVMKQDESDGAEFKSNDSGAIIYHIDQLFWAFRRAGA